MTDRPTVTPPASPSAATVGATLAKLQRILDQTPPSAGFSPPMPRRLVVAIIQALTAYSGDQPPTDPAP